MHRRRVVTSKRIKNTVYLTGASFYTTINVTNLALALALIRTWTRMKVTVGTESLVGGL